MRTTAERFKFWIAELLERSDRVCWSELCSWALGHSKFRECFSGKMCCRDSEREPHRICYCGKFKDGKRWTDGGRRDE